MSPVHAHGVSSAAATASDGQERRDALAAAIAAYEQESEPFTHEEIERARQRLREARSRDRS